MGTMDSLQINLLQEIIFTILFSNLINKFNLLFSF